MDDFSDDGFEDIDASVLQELEKNAIQFTQAAHAPPESTGISRPVHTPESSGLNYDFEDDDLDDAVVIDELAQIPAVSAVGREKSAPPPPPQSTANPDAAGQQRWNQPAAPSVAPRPPVPIPSQHYPLRQVPPHPPRNEPTTSRPPPTQCQFARRPPPPISQRYPAQRSETPQQSRVGNHSDVVTALQTRLRTLEAELTSAKGEISIVRSKYDKAQATHDAEIARLKKQNTEQLAKQERLVEAAITAERTAATELQFTRQDLKEELGKAKLKRKDGAATPKKNKSFGMADGFDDIELMASPSKGRAEKGKAVGPIAFPLNERTPTKGKRKRPVFDSPANALEIHSDDVVMVDDTPSTDVEKQPASPPRPQNELPFDFLKLVLDHSSMHGQPPTFDLLSRFAFPSDPSQSFAALVFHRLPLLGNSEDPRQLLVDFSLMIIDMWSQCLREKYYSPIYYLVSLVAFVLHLNTMEVAPHIITYLVPVAQTTCFLVAVQRFSSPDGDLSNHSDPTVQQLNADIDVTSTLAVLYLVALASASLIPEEPSDTNPSSNPQPELWRLVEMEFVLVMLSQRQQPVDFLGMLSLLRTSVCANSIGPIPNPEGTSASTDNGYAKTADAVAYALIERVSLHLADTPRWAGRGTEQQCEVRLAVLRTLSSFARSPFAARHLAAHENAIPRLVAVLSGALDALYDMDVPDAVSAPPADEIDDDDGDDDGDADASTPPEAMQVDAESAEAQPAAVAPGSSMTKQADDAKNEGGVKDAAPDDQPAAEAAEETSRPSEERASPAGLYQIIADTMRLLHFLITDDRTAGLANIHNKLATTAGGAQRYLLTLARLNFAEEDLVLEAGIEVETVELAHELLEMAVTPDEGESVGEVFGL